VTTSTKKTVTKATPKTEAPDYTLAIATLTGVLLQRGHSAHSAVEQAKKILELIHEPS
jgi:hypothetical protein